MNIFPAIDILGGEAVRLYKGDYAQKTVYGDPAEIAGRFRDMGAKHLHVVDLDGARDGSPRNLEIIMRLGGILPVQVGGGIRDAETVDKYLQIAGRVILGTAAVEKPEFAGEMVGKHGAERIAVGVDVRERKVMAAGWLANSGVDYLEFIELLKQMGVKLIIVTDTVRDGTLTSPNWEMYEGIKGINVIVSGGISSETDIEKARKYYGVIVGKAYYEGLVDLECLLKNA
ncbi:MAG: 1-(5-phosphoribosyl)-5-[(5-phosphoribosylamino)methylideneamino] imidazole-4-carboxamide isomerase [Defluviitaleaceae bacterium]|nr:1-(5-phosphoribosyl)-5-[(5-phosphoribosylamino)methylideneamino] imidazole-4-carboxamide isomerase [Defluviitaleaceae bacterium]